MLAKVSPAARRGKLARKLKMQHLFAKKRAAAFAFAAKSSWYRGLQLGTNLVNTNQNLKSVAF
jgi:hypothetical protein